MLFTSLGGSTIMMTGVLGLLHQYDLYMNAPEEGQAYVSFVQTLIFNDQWFLPITLLAPTIVGLVIQNKFIKKSSEWEI